MKPSTLNRIAHEIPRSLHRVEKRTYDEMFALLGQCPARTKKDAAEWIAINVFGLNPDDESDAPKIADIRSRY